MATMLQSESRRLYSWWWDSHISPKNSKWLQDNLTDMDSKVKAMIKLIEEDADSFARRAEMYYKKRPELMKMVEEFYRAYRALAERYDHATGALRQAHNTMAKAFPNQIPLVLTDDSPSGSSGPEVESRTPDMPSPIHTLFDFDDFDKDACLPSHSHVIKRSGTYSEENNILSRKGLKQLNEIYPTGEGEEAYANLSEGRVKKGRHFLAEEGKGYEYKNSRGLKEDTQNEIKRLREELTLLVAENQNLKSQKTSESERADKAESDVRNLKDSLSKLSFENEDITLEYKQAVERIASMETKMSQIQDEFKKLNDVIVLEAMKLDSAENRCVLLDKENQSLLLELEAKEQKTKDLQEENSQLSTENWNLKTQVASDSQRADKAESEVQSVKDNLSKSKFEMEAAIFQYRQSVERISYLEADLSRTENDFTKLSDEMVMQAAKLNSAEDRCLVLLEENRSLRLQLDSLEQKIKAQRQEHDQLSAENEYLMSLITTESDRAQKAEIEVQLVKSHISELNFEKEAAVSQYQQSLEMISCLQTQASQAQEEYIKLRDEMAMEAMKLSSAEEKSLVLDNANQSLKTELGILKQTIRNGQEEISQLSAVIENLKSQLTLESERAYKAETEVQNLRDSLSKSNFENESCIQQYQQSLEKISYLETQISQAQDDYKKLTDEMIAETMKSRLVDERCVLLEKVNESIKLEVGTLEKEKKAAEEEVIYHRLELEKINTSLQDEHERLVKTQMALLSMENLHSESQEEVKRLGLEIQCAVHKLNDAELKNISLEEESCNIKEENSALNEQNLSSALQIKVLQDETNILKEMNGKFENEMRLYLEENKLLQHNFDRLKEDKNELEQKHLNLTAQMEVVSLNAESLHASLKKLQDENVELHEICKTHEEEKSLLLENLKTMEDISVKNRVMENSLEDANVELQELRMTIKALEQSCEALNEEVSTYITEKSTLISQIETITQNTEKLMEENTLLENSSSVLNLEVEGLRGKLNDVEDSLRSLDDQKESLTTERNILVSQVDTITQNKEKLMEENDFLENSLSLVNLEVEGLREKLKNLEDSLQSLYYAEKEILIAERNNLVSQVETATQNTDKLMEENTFLENTSLVNLEVEGLRVKLKYSEDSLQSLYTEKDNLTAERNTIVSQVETMTQNTEKLMEEKAFLENSLSLVNLEVEGLRGKLKDLENSLQSFYTEKENLTSERNTLVSQVETLTQNSENLTEENAFLVNSLSLVNLEVEGLRGKLKDYENSLQSLYTEKENLTSERNTLVSQVETLTQNSENLTEENAFLVNSLSLVNLEVEGLREKLKDLEDSLQSLYTQKENLTAERNTLLSQVDSISQTLESVENRRAELEIKHLNLEKENRSRINEVLELESVLNLEKKGHATFVQSSKNQLSILEDQILVLREENQVREDEVEVEQRKVMSHQIELLVLHSFLRDMNEVILRLSWDCQKHLEASRCAEKLVSKLQEEGTIQMDEMSLLLAHNEKVKEGIFMLLRALNINDCVSENREKDEVLLEIVLDEIRNLLNSVSGAEDEVQLLQLEMSVIITLLGQTGLHVEDLRIEKQFLEKELEIRKDEVSVLQCNKQELLEINEQLRQDIEHSNHREEEMKYAMGALQWQLSDSQDAQHASQTEIHKVLDEYQSLLRTSDSLREKKEALEEENSVVIAEAMTLEHLYLLFRSFGTERAFELKLFSDDAYCLSAVNNNLDREIRQMNEKFRVLETENIHLKESVACMEEYRRCLLGLQFDLHTSKYYCDELIDQVETGSNLLVQKERELSETNEKVQSTQKKIVEFSRNLECLNEEIYKAKIAREELQNKNFSLSEGIACKDKEIERIGEVNESLYDKLKILNSEVGTLRSREEQLTSRLQNGIDEIDRCEVEIMTLLSDTQFSTVSAAIFEEKVFELMLESESLEISAMIQREVLNEEIHSRNAYARELKEKLDDLEGENRGLKAHLDAYLPLVMSLQDGIASLQEQTLSLTRHPGSINQESQENIVASHQQHDEDPLGEDPTSTVPSGLLELQKLTAKFGVLQKVITDTASLLEKERVDYNTDLEAARKEIREMQEKRSSSQEENKASKAVVTQLENDSEHSKLKHVQMMKDIQLDQVSSSPYENSIGSYGPTRIENSETDDQMLKLWEAAERACMGQMKRPPQLVLAHDIEPVEEEKSEYPSSELVAEKELSVDRLEVSSNQEWSRKVIERLASDTQRLLVLRTSMQELERKMENYEKGKQPKSLEYDTIRTKLNEAEGTVLELIDINSKLAKKAEEFPTGSSGAQEETERRWRMRISGRAQRGSEKVDRLELELQKIQYIMLKLEEEHSNDIAKASDRRPKIILGDYIHEKRNVEKPKRRSFCGCIRPKTKDN